MAPVYTLIWGAVLVFGASAVAALAWAVQSGQLRDLSGGACSIFDAAEPVGEVTDAFPAEPVAPEVKP
jgi:nitrogen fixation-related uncharacterized protein